MGIQDANTGQNLIKRTLSEPDSITRVRALLKANGRLNRLDFADRVCEEFGFYDPRGERQRSGCLKALRELEQQGAFRLPAAQAKSGPGKPRGLGEPVPVPKNVPEEVHRIRALELLQVETEEDLRLWNELMLREHPQGERVLVGRQLRYLVRSEHGWLGALGFAASAIYLQARDRWIGWDDRTKQTHLHRVVGLSRFLIRTEVHCQNLASKVLGMCLRRFPADFESKYGYEPWLVESFVDPAHFSGNCYRATNWAYVGKTQGRGRQDRRMEAKESVKDIYLYPLMRDFRERMGLPADAGRSPLKPEHGLDSAGWAEQEFGAAQLGDQRLTRRLVSLVKTKSAHPDKSWLQALEGDGAAIKGYWRLVDHKDTSAVNMGTILNPHRECTLRRMQAHPRVLTIQDESDLNYAGLKECEGLGPIGKNQTTTETKGLRLHSMYAVAPDTGLPLGVLRSECFAPELKPKHKGKDGRYIPLEEKKTFRWVLGLRDSMDLSKQLPSTRVINVTDREGDFFELFDERRQNPCVGLLVRAKHDRRTVEGEKLFASVRGSRVRARFTIDICRRSARPKKGKQSALPARPARQAQVQLRYKQVTLCAPHCGLNQHKDPIPIWIIHVVEKRPPKGQKPVEWLLLTTVEIDSVEKAMECVRWYTLRWRIEDFHKVVQSGCRVEDAAHDKAERLERVIAMCLPVAWRIHLMTLLARETPELPSEVLFTSIEIEVLGRLAETRSKQHTKKTTEPGTSG